MKRSLWTPLALVLGLVLMVAGPLSVSYLVPAEALWTDADAEKLGQARADLHAALHANSSHRHAHVHGQGGVSEAAEMAEKQVPDLAAAQHDFEEQQARLERSRSRRDWLWYAATILGALLASAGVAGHFLAGRGG